MVEKVDIVCGGFPCQDISLAGKGTGLAGKRSGLWRYMLRAVCMVRPRFVVVENVAALLGRGMGTVLGDLAESGYDTEWDCLPACTVGAPHIRDRVWIVADSMRFRHIREATTNATAYHKWHDPPHRKDGQAEPNSPEPNTQNVADLDRKRELQPKGMQQNIGQWVGHSPPRIFQGAAIERSEQWANEPGVARMVHGIPDRVDRVRGLGNAVVPQIAQWIAERIKEVSRCTD